MPRLLASLCGHMWSYNTITIRQEIFWDSSGFFIPFPCKGKNTGKFESNSDEATGGEKK